MLNMKKSGKSNDLKKAIKKEDPQADLTGSKTGTVSAKVISFLNLVYIINVKFLLVHYQWFTQTFFVTSLFCIVGFAEFDFLYD